MMVCSNSSLTYRLARSQRPVMIFIIRRGGVASLTAIAIWQRRLPWCIIVIR